MRDMATLSPSFQIPVPEAVREVMNWKVGQTFVFIQKIEGVLLVPVPDQEELAGIAKGAIAGSYRDRTLERA